MLVHDSRPGETLDDRLAEIDFGAWEGQPWDRVVRADFDAWMNDFAEARSGTHG